MKLRKRDVLFINILISVICINILLGIYTGIKINACYIEKNVVQDNSSINKESIIKKENNTNNESGSDSAKKINDNKNFVSNTQNIEIPYEYNRNIKTSLSDEEFSIYVALIFCEVGAEPYETKLGVANVVLNRIYSNRYPNTLKEVVYDPYQFSPVREGKLDIEISNYKAGKYTTNNHLECIKAAKEAMEGYNNVGDRIGFLTPDYLERLFGGQYSDKLQLGRVAFFNV